MKLLGTNEKDLDEGIKSLSPPIQKVRRISKIISKIGLLIISILIIIVVVISYNLKEENIIDKEMKILKDKAVKELGNEKVSFENNELKLSLSNNILFDYNKTELNVDSKSKLKLIISEINSEMVVEIIGHTDNIGGECYNYKLSHSRAETVFKHLSSIATPYKSVYYGLGEDFPISTNNTEYGRQLNRRVEIKIKKSKRISTSFKEGLVDKVSFFIQKNPISIIISFIASLLTILSIFITFLTNIGAMVKNKRKKTIANNV